MSGALYRVLLAYWGRSGRCYSFGTLESTEKIGSTEFWKCIQVSHHEVLSTRLKQLEQVGLIVAIEKRKTYPMIVRWALTEKGSDVIPILMIIVAYGSKYNADLLYGEKQVRKLPEIFNDEGMELIRRYF